MLNIPSGPSRQHFDDAYCIGEGKTYCDSLPLKFTLGQSGIFQNLTVMRSMDKAVNDSGVLYGLPVTPTTTLNAFCTALPAKSSIVVDASVAAVCDGCRRIMAAESTAASEAISRMCPMTVASPMVLSSTTINFGMRREGTTGIIRFAAAWSILMFTYATLGASITK
ncbi:hypothetical protein ACHHYP_04790 [Achlya hypogyna]|uniref:Uncharacterized protein n=1 Tax=Achlya hypogyna TaxID=1202772 RepID=A0A1V9Z006_ACHHY|nr:hypothetical protein ACHHYP_04790 [Achlya hypogyna]